MAVKGAIRVVVLVVPHIELCSRHQYVLRFRQGGLLGVLVTQIQVLESAFR